MGYGDFAADECPERAQRPCARLYTNAPCFGFLSTFVNIPGSPKHFSSPDRASMSLNVIEGSLLVHEHRIGANVRDVNVGHPRLSHLVGSRPQRHLGIGRILFAIAEEIGQGFALMRWKRLTCAKRRTAWVPMAGRKTNFRKATGW